MSRIVLRVAQIVGVLVLAGIAVGVVAGLVQWLLGVAVLVAIPIGLWWLYRQVSDRTQKPVTGRATDRRSELESRAVLDAAGRCGWCGSPTLHKDDFGFPVTPLAHHRAEIDAML
jgi:ABC-type transport system involved in cytochrome bd biosynthesis fused ATPase/permease subunit